MVSQYERELSDKISQKTALVAVVGLGYVGLPLLAAFHDAGFPVLGFDVDEKKPSLLKQGQNYLPHLGEDLCRAFRSSSRFSATSDPEELSRADVAIVCVPTPLGKHAEPDLSYLAATARVLGIHRKPGQLFCLESTSFPSTTRDYFFEGIINASAARPELGQDTFVAFSPEREDPGRKNQTTKTIPKLVGGLDPSSTRLAMALYGASINTVVACSSAEVAESAKILENVFRAVNIALANEMKQILEPMGINVWEVIEAASTKPFGFMPFYPGPGLGGHCIPIDPFYLSWKAKETGTTARFIELAGQVNTKVTDYVVQRITWALNESTKPVRGSRILVLGIAYKPNVSDTRESPSLEIISQLRRLGASVDYSDPHCLELTRVRKHEVNLASTTLDAETIGAYDACILATNHEAFDYQLLATHAQLVVDTRNAFAPFAAAMGSRLVRA